MVTWRANGNLEGKYKPEGIVTNEAASIPLVTIDYMKHRNVEHRIGFKSMAIVFVFVNFLFYKILSTALFDDSLTIWASAITAIIVTLIVAYSGAFGFIFSSKEVSDGKTGLDPLRVGLIIVGACILSSIAGYLVALGFSDRLYSDISRWTRYRDFWEQDLVWFCIMISIPVIVQLCLFFWKISKAP